MSFERKVRRARKVSDIEATYGSSSHKVRQGKKQFKLDVIQDAIDCDKVGRI